ncbi:MAG: hypothetical protein KKD63_11095 [Proteobacteria bacterium]|nr:hypothetical protein [Desulfobulbaceae bacterium]MBU4153417.1 hypothetical protein [Pseudomonadota bacterium]
MTIKKDSGRQDVGCAIVEFTYADLTSGVFAAAVELPIGAIVVGGAVRIDQAFNSGLTDVISVGISTSTGKYGSGFNVHAVGSFPLTGLCQEEDAMVDVGITWTGGGAAPSAGKARLVVMYVKSGKTEFSQG